MGKRRGNAMQEQRSKTISSWGYVGYSILYLLPVIGWIFLLVFSFSRNACRRNYARSYWCRLLLAFALGVAVTVLSFTGTGEKLLANFNYAKAKVESFATDTMHSVFKADVQIDFSNAKNPIVIRKW